MKSCRPRRAVRLPCNRNGVGVFFFSYWCQQCEVHRRTKKDVSIRNVSASMGTSACPRLPHSFHPTLHLLYRCPRFRRRAHIISGLGFIESISGSEESPAMFKPDVWIPPPHFTPLTLVVGKCRLVFACAGPS